MITWIWIEGEKALNDFCQRRFKDKPRFVETCGRVGSAKIRLIYKYVYKEDGETVDRVAEMYLLYMDAPYDMEKGNVIGSGCLPEIERMSYEKIRADKTAILKR